MSRRKIDWFARGRDAFTEARPELLTDGRINAQDRANWHAGYNHQRSLNRPQITPQESAEIIAEIQAIKDSL